MGLIIIGVIISTGSMNFGAIVAAQNGDLGFFNWYFIPHFPMVFLFFISALAETNRPPFDLPEAESELVAGYQVEYSSTPFLLFMAGEYIAIFLMCALITLLFFGGWASPVPFIADGPVWMVGKMAIFFFLIAMVKALVPRYRYDQLIKNKKTIGKCGMKYQLKKPKSPFCAATIAPKFIDPVEIITPIMIKPIETS